MFDCAGKCYESMVLGKKFSGELLEVSDAGIRPSLADWTTLMAALGG